MLIGLSGRDINGAGVKQVGKDTVAQYLAKYKFNRHGFADKVKAYAYAINPIIGYYEAGDMKLQEFVDEVGWEKAKESPEVRAFLQRMGGEARTVFGKDFWVDQLFNELIKKYDTYDVDFHPAIQSNVVIPDLRYENEAQRIKAYGGKIIEIVRDTGLEKDTHASEIPLPSKYLDGVLHNIGTLEDLHNGIEEMLTFLKQ